MKKEFIILGIMIAIILISIFVLINLRKNMADIHINLEYQYDSNKPEDVMQMFHTVFIGKVIDKTKVDYEKSEGRTDMPFTYYEIEVADNLNSTFTKGEKLTLKIIGGQNKNGYSRTIINNIEEGLRKNNYYIFPCEKIMDENVFSCNNPAAIRHLGLDITNELVKDTISEYKKYQISPDEDLDMLEKGLEMQEERMPEESQGPLMPSEKPLPQGMPAVQD